MPNQFGIDAFDLEDALSAQENHMCSADLKEFIESIIWICHRTAAFLPEMPLAAMTIPTMYTIPQEPGTCCGP